MTARTVVASLSGAVLSISASLAAAQTSGSYGGLSWTPVGQVENFGNHGMSANITEFTPIDTATVAKVKGSKNYGNMNLTLGHMPGDSGQALMKAASELSARYSIKLAYADGGVHYLEVLVAKFEYQDGAVNDVQKVNVELAVCRAPVIVDP